MTQMVAREPDQRHSDPMLSALLSALLRIHLVVTYVPPTSAGVPTALTPKLPVDRLQSSLEHGTPEAFAITVASSSIQSA